MTARYEPAIDVTAVDAIDFHTHVEIDGAGHCAYDDELAEATGRYFKLGPDYFARVDDLAEHYRQHNTAAVVFTIDAHTVSGHQPNSVEELIEGTSATTTSSSRSARSTRGTPTRCGGWGS